MQTQKHGAQESKFSICVNNFKINLYKTLPKFQNYDTIRETKKLKLFSNLYLPIELTTDTYYEKVTNQVTYTQEEAKQILTKKLEDEVAAGIGENKNIINKQINEYEEDGQIEIEVIYEVLENIGTKEKIIF